MGHYQAKIPVDHTINDQIIETDVKVAMREKALTAKDTIAVNNAVKNIADISVSRVVLLSELVDELMKDSPCDKAVRDYMKRVGLEYSEDSIELLSSVLHAIQNERPIYENQR